MPNTEENLFKAFEEESAAAVRVKIYADEAEKEGYPDMARLFRAVARSEAIHARNNLKLLNSIQDTETNLYESFAKEKELAHVSYGDYIVQAGREGLDAAVKELEWSRDVEKIHAKLYEEALEHMLENKGSAYYVCEPCGYISDGKIPEKCPVCGAPAKLFFESS
ncbi:MAG: rubrerythrin family protein [Actinobacteria bacterium]|nr:rubrerythrin family protein [Actinomycetota bacterium]